MLSYLHTLTVIFTAIALTTATLTSCTDSGTSALRDRLALVDTLMFCDPQAALDTLATLPDTISDPETAAWRDLLLVKAGSKAYQMQSTELGKKIYDYYAGKGDSLEVQSAFYNGEILHFNQKEDSALIILTDAFDTALKQNNMFYAGMSARCLAETYGNLLLPDKEYEYATVAKEYFTKSGHPIHAAWMDPMIIESLTLRELYDEALDLCKSIDTIQYNTNDFFRHSILGIKALTYYFYEQYDSCGNIYSEMINDGYEMTGPDWCLLANNNLKGNDIIGTYQARENALKFKLNKKDSILLAMTNSELSAYEGNYQMAYEELYHAENNQSQINDILIQHPKVILLSDYLKAKNKNQEKDSEIARKNATIIILIVIILACISFLIIILLTHKIKKDRILYQETKSHFLKTIEDKDQHINSILHELQKAQKLKDDAEIQLEAILKEPQEYDMELLSKYLYHINTLCSVYFNNIDIIERIDDKSTKNFILRLQREFIRIRDSKLIDTIIKIKEEKNGNSLENLNAECEYLTNTEKDLIMYTYAGFNATTIALFTGRPSTNSIYQDRHKVKLKIEKNSPSQKGLIDLIFSAS